MKKRFDIAEDKTFIRVVSYDFFMDGDFRIPKNIEVDYFSDKELGEARIEWLIENYNLKIIFEKTIAGTKFQTYESGNKSNKV